MMNTVLKLSLALGALSLSANSLYAVKWTELQNEESRESLQRKIDATAEAFQDKYVKDKTDLNEKKSKLWSTAASFVVGNETDTSVEALVKWLNENDLIVSLRKDIKALKGKAKLEKEADSKKPDSKNITATNPMESFNPDLFAWGDDTGEKEEGVMRFSFPSTEGEEIIVDTSFLKSSSGSGSLSQSEGSENSELKALKRNLSEVNQEIEHLTAQLEVFANPQKEAAQAVAKAKTVDRSLLSRDEKQYVHEYHTALDDLERAKVEKAELEAYLKEKYLNQ